VSLSEEFELLKGAILIADAHENNERKGFWEFLCALEKGEIKTKQLILMGDIFDLLVGEISSSHNFAKPYIELLERLGEKIQILYLEGNHDFNLQNFFTKVRVYKIQKQPLKAVLYKEKQPKEILYLAHGDIFLPPLIQWSLKMLRNRFLLYFLNCLNILSLNLIYKKILTRQKKKNLFYKIENFEFLARKRYEKFRANKAWVIEGHYHQDFLLKEKEVKYFNLASFAYKRSFFVVEYEQEISFQEEKFRGRNV